MFTHTEECPVGIEPTSPAWKAGTFAARPRAHKAAEAGIEPASRRLTVAFPYQHRTHRINESGRLDSNQRSPASKAGGMTKLSHVLKMRPAGIEPTHPAWQAGRLPLHHGRKLLLTKLSKIDNAKRSIEHRVGLEPTSPLYESGVLAARRPVLCVIQWDQRDSNPHPAG